jgi:hypothetical protein
MATETSTVKETGEKKDSEWTPTPIETIHPIDVDPGKIRLFKEPEWILRMTIDGDRSYLRVKVVRAAPLTQPDRYFCILDIKDEAICMVENMDQLEEASRPFVFEELDRRYLTAEIQSIVSLQNEYGVSYWDVNTDRGRREFVAKSVSENAQWLGDSRLMIFDVDGNRFEVPDKEKLDKRSLGLLESVL